MQRVITHKHLEVFRAICRTGNLTRAAEMIGISQPSVSRLTQQLQADVGFRLFARIDGVTVPTAEAALLLAEVDRSFTGVDAILRSADRIRNRRTGHLRIISMPALAHSFLPAVISEFALTHPDVAVSLQVERADSIPRWMISHQVDLGFASLPLDAPGVTTELFDEAPGQCVLPTGHRLADRTVLTPTDLLGEPLISSGPNGRMENAVRAAFESSRVRYDPVIETPLSAVACQMVRAGAGVTIADRFAATHFSAQGLIARPFLPEIPVRFGVLLPRYTVRSAIAEAFLETLARARDMLFAGRWASAHFISPPAAGCPPHDGIIAGGAPPCTSPTSDTEPSVSV
ncbi:MAG: LysR substrate-binding domain-containing protein [Salipiger thiooxidans]